MSDPEPSPGRRDIPPAGLCGTCAHQRLISNTRGSTFSMCDRSRNDQRYPRYPPLPVLACAGHEQREPGTAAPEGPR